MLLQSQQKIFLKHPNIRVVLSALLLYAVCLCECGNVMNLCVITITTRHRASLYHAPKLHPGPRSSVGVRPRTDTQTDARDHNTFLVVFDSREM